MDVATARIYKDAVDNKGREYGAGIAGTIKDIQQQVHTRLEDETR